MTKIKFFIDPISKIEPWLNQIAAKGYRLKSVYLFIYQFEKTDEKVHYITQFIGAKPNKENREYINMLVSLGHRTFRAPINQGNVAIGKVRVRPYGKGSAKLATSFDNYNKEILIVENTGSTSTPLLTTHEDMSQAYKDGRNAYLQGFLTLTVFFLYLLWKGFTTGFTPASYYSLPLLGGLILLLFFLVLSKHRLYAHYRDEARLRE